MAIGNATVYTVQGSSDIIPQSRQRTWNLTDGVQTFKRFAGTSDAILQKFNELTAAGSTSGVDNIQEDINGHAGSLLCRIVDDSGGSDGGNTEETNAVWEVIGQDVLKPIETHSDFDSITTLRKRYVEKCVRDATALDAAATAAEKKLYAYMSAQVLDFPVTEIILRKTISVSIRSSLVLSYASINRVVIVPSAPAALVGVLTSLPKMDGSSGQWEWLKKAPQLRQTSKRRFQITYEWWGVERWAEIYGGSWDPAYA